LLCNLYEVASCYPFFELAEGSQYAYDADWFRDALKDKGIKPCISGGKSRAKLIKHDKRRYKRRNRIEIMFGRMKDWRRVATRYDRCLKVFLSAVALAATVMFWL
jgi:transposase